MTAACPSPKDCEVSRLLDIVLQLAADDTAPTVDMRPLSLIVNTLGCAVDGRDDADVIKAALVGALAWIARERWPEVMAEVRRVAGRGLQ